MNWIPYAVGNIATVRDLKFVDLGPQGGLAGTIFLDIGGPTRELDGSILTFLNEEEGLACTACGTRRDEFPSRACGVRVRETDKELRVGCYPIPQLCLDDYHLRHTNGFGFGGRSNEFGPPVDSHTPALVGDGERGSDVSTENESIEEEQHDFTRETSKVHGFEHPSGNKTENGPITASWLGHGSTTSNLFRSMKFSSDNFTMLSVPIEDSHPKGFESDLQDITATGTVDTVESREQVKMTLPTSAKTFSPLLSNTQETSNSTIIPNVRLVPNAPQHSQGEREVISDLDDQIKESKEILIEKRRDHHFFGTTTTTSTIPPTTTPRKCIDKHKCAWRTSVNPLESTAPYQRRPPVQRQRPSQDLQALSRPGWVQHHRPPPQSPPHQRTRNKKQVATTVAASTSIRKNPHSDWIIGGPVREYDICLGAGVIWCPKEDTPRKHPIISATITCSQSSIRSPPASQNLSHQSLPSPYNMPTSNQATSSSRPQENPSMEGDPVTTPICGLTYGQLTPKPIKCFSGSDDQDFESWLRKFEDLVHMVTPPLPDQLRINTLVVFWRKGPGISSMTCRTSMKIRYAKSG
ncbi:hypothetical protein OSTOST_01530 [Ostertagia ostertagi]